MDEKFDEKLVLLKTAVDELEYALENTKYDLPFFALWDTMFDVLRRSLRDDNPDYYLEGIACAFHVPYSHE